MTISEKMNSMPFYGYFGASDEDLLAVTINSRIKKIRITGATGDHLRLRGIKFIAPDGAAIQPSEDIVPSQSSSAHGLTADRLLHMQIVCTKNESKPYWEADLRNSPEVSRVLIYNYTYLGGFSNTKGIHVEVLSSEGDWREVFSSKTPDYLGLPFDLEYQIERDVAIIEGYIEDILGNPDWNGSWNSILCFLGLKWKTNKDLDLQIIGAYCAHCLKNKGFLTRAYYEMFSKCLDSRRKIEKVVEVASKRTGRDLKISIHGIFVPWLRNSRDRHLKTVQSFSALLRNHDYFVFSAFGTLIGLIREGDFLSHDDDVDVMVVPLSGSRTVLADVLENVVNIATAAGCSIKNRYPGHAHVVPPGGQVLDVFPLTFSDDEFSIYSYIAPGNAFRFPAQDLLPAQSVSVHGVLLDFPNKPENILRAIYGAGWKTEDKFFAWPWELID